MTRQTRQRLVLVATILGSSMAFLDAFVVNVALPTIDKDFGLGLAGEQWIFLSYSLALAALYLPAGALGDRYGYANTFVVGVSGFAVASVLAGAAPNEAVLIAARAVQGVFGALLTPGSLALLRATYRDEAGRAIGSWTAWTGIATAAGPVFGGTLVEAVSWRVIFFLNIPFAIVTVVATLVSRDTCRTERKDRRLDIPGVVLGAIGIGALVWSLVQGPKDGFASGGVVVGFVLAAASLIGFVLVEWRSPHPMMPLSLFRIRELSVANIATFFIYAALGSALFFLILFAQSVLGYSPVEAGLLVVPISISLLLLAARFGRAADRICPRPFLVAGPILIGIGLALLGRLDASSTYWRDVFPPLIVFSVGLSATVPAVTSTALKPAPDGLTGIASGINTTVSRLGQLLAVAGLGVVVSLVFGTTGGSAFELGSRGTQELADASHAFRAAMWSAAGLAIAGALVSGFGLPRGASSGMGAIRRALRRGEGPPPASPPTV
jgi:EmrB/QacA subfamily drug resistance transporter